MGPLHLLVPTHLAMGYLIGIYSRFPIPALVVGSALPDLVDRPLYWLGLTPAPHTIGHSLAVAIPICLLLLAVGSRQAIAVAIGWLLHVATDALNVLTTRGIEAVPAYVLRLGPVPEYPVTDAAVTITLPLTAVTHTLHPAVLVAELAVLGWAGVVLGRRLAPRVTRSIDSR